jgi:hypothetical protein
MNKSILLLFCVSILFLAMSFSPANADILPPKKQISFGISGDDVICESGMFKVIKVKTNAISCVYVKNVSKLVSLGWAKPVDQTKLDYTLSQQNLSSARINQLIITPIFSDFGKLTHKTSVGSYDFVFDVCASQTIVSPTVLIRSDSESKLYEIPETINSNSCVTSAVVIKASNSDSIVATLQSKDDVSKTILSLSEKIDSLKMQLQDAKKSFGKEKSDNNNQLSTQIIDLRKQLNEAKEDLQRLYFVLYTSPENSKITLQKLSFLGNPIDGESATKISVGPSISSPNSFNVFFEACAGKKQVRLPVITVTSDFESIDVKMGDKISPNTCQMSSAKITATDPESISIKPAGNADSSTKADELEFTINNLQKEFASEKNILKELIHNSKRPVNFNEQLSLHVDKITQLRNDIISAKAELSKILYLTYK